MCATLTWQERTLWSAGAGPRVVPRSSNGAAIQLSNQTMQLLQTNTIMAKDPITQNLNFASDVLAWAFEGSPIDSTPQDKAERSARRLSPTPSYASAATNGSARRAEA
eukprot:Tamp_28252.p1 GENE.Tamp_28252~~Tamp_28252.p1  ORF type:complete len:108 (+),score=10.18 Tamp_28252:258-581(+)